jgi:hypothetical protein
MHVAREPVELGHCERTAQRVRDKAVQRPAILQEDCHIGLPRINTRRDLGEHLAAQGDDSGIRSRSLNGLSPPAPGATAMA